VSLCECGCGKDAGVFSRTNKKFGYVKGANKRYINGHQLHVKPGRIWQPRIQFCLRCGSEYTATSPGQKYCSKACQRPRHPAGWKRPKEWQQDQPQRWKPDIRQCQLCGAHYTATSPGQKFCTHLCKQEKYKREKDAPTPKQQKDLANIKVIRRLYGMSIDDYKRMWQAQGGVCAICKQTCKQHARLSVDHDHFTREVRGLLCGKCNSGIGMFKDDVELLTAAIQYLGGNEAIDRIIDDNIERYGNDRI
jgi:hypothetical protein